MTEKEKMLSGQLYDANDAALGRASGIEPRSSAGRITS